MPKNAINAAIDEIVERTELWAEFWRNAHGWAPADAAVLLSRSRLDLQVDLARCLRDWASHAPRSDGHLVLAWANLGALVEGALMLLCCVYYEDYRREAVPTSQSATPDTLTLEPLRVFFSEHVWLPAQAERWDPWIRRVLEYRNAIHAFRNRNLGDFDEFESCVRDYLDLICDIEERLPYPDDYRATFSNPRSWRCEGRKNQPREPSD